MLLTISTTHYPATDLGFLLHKNPTRLQSEDLSFGRAAVFYPEASEDRCTAALLVDVDSIALVRGKGPSGEGRQLDQYVNDRPYVANSFLSVAMGKVFNTAMSGRSKERPILAETPIPLLASLPVVAAKGGESLLKLLFEPLGYSVTSTGSPLDAAFPEWGDSPYFAFTIAATVTLRDLLTHLYVLIPVLDNDKHYWIAQDELEKLLRRGEGWLATHPEKDLIVSRYLKRSPNLTREALRRLLADSSPTDEQQAEVPDEGDPVEPVVPLHQQRLEAVLSVLKESGARRVLDLGCGEAKLLRLLLEERQFDKILGMDVSWRSLEIASRRLKLDRMNERQRARIDLIQGSLTYRDSRLAGYDAAAIVEVIEHLDPARLAAFERAIFEFAHPALVVLTTPNAEYNANFPTLPAGQFRHDDHRFEWTRAEFETWSAAVATRFGYAVQFEPIGPLDAELGAVTQMAIFRLSEAAS